MARLGGKAGAVTALTAALVLRWPATARAHLVSTGMGPFYDGIGHLLVTPQDLIPALMLALYAGLRGTGHGRRAVFCLPLGWIIGGLAAARATAQPHLPVAALSFLLLGVLVAADLRLPASAVAALAVILGLAHGLLNGIAVRDQASTAGVLGSALALFVLVALLSAFTVSLRRRWARVAVRVAGSWVAASGILMFGWFAAGRG